MALVAAGLWTVASVLWHVADRAMTHGGEWSPLGIPDLIAVVAVAASVALFAYTRQRDRDSRRIMDLGLAYMVVTGMSLGLVFHWMPMREGRTISPEISWIGAVVTC